MPHRVWAIILLGVGVGIFAMARQIATWKTRTWAKFYAQHPGAAEKNPLSKHARKGVFHDRRRRGRPERRDFSFRAPRGLVMMRGVCRATNDVSCP